MENAKQENRRAIASELSNILFRQQAILQCSLHLKKQFESDDRAKGLFEEIVDDDRRSLRILEGLTERFEYKEQPLEVVQNFTPLLAQFSAYTHDLSYEQLEAFLLLKQSQKMSAHLIHKAMQASTTNLRSLLVGFDAVYSSISRHVGQLAVLIERLAVTCFLGQEPHARSTSGARPSAPRPSRDVIRFDDSDRTIIDVLKSEHRGVDQLFEAIEKASDPARAFDAFRELRGSLTTHGEAEEETVYLRYQTAPELRELLERSWDEHEEMRSLLEVIAAAKSDRELFRSKIETLKQLVARHVKAEENEVFPYIQQASDEPELIDLAHEFLLVKQGIEDNQARRGDSVVTDDGMRAPRLDRSISH